MHVNNNFMQCMHKTNSNTNSENMTNYDDAHYKNKKIKIIKIILKNTSLQSISPNINTTSAPSGIVSTTHLKLYMCECESVRACVRVCVCVCVRACMHACMRASAALTAAFSSRFCC